MADNEINDWEDVPVDEEDDWEDVPLGGDTPGVLETALRSGAQFVTGGWSDKIPKAENLEQKLNPETGKYEPAMTEEEGYQTEQARTAQAKEVNPGAALAGQGLGFLGAGGARLLAALPGLARATPAAIRALGTSAGWKAAGLGGAKAAPVGAAAGAATSTGMAPAGEELADPADLAADTALGAAGGAALGGALGAAGAGATARANSAAQAAQKARDQALVLAGLEGKQRTLGGGRRAQEAGHAIYDEQLPGGERLIDELVTQAPDKSLALTEGLRNAEGKVLGGVRERLASLPTASVDPAALKTAMAQKLTSLPTEARAAATAELDRMIDSRLVNGQLPADGLRSVLDELTKLGKFGAPNLQAALGNKNAMPFQRAYGPAVEAEKGLVGKHFPDELAQYEEALRKYGIFDKAAMGADVKFQRANKGQPPIKEPASKAQTLAGQLVEDTPVIGPPARTLRKYFNMLPNAQRLPSQIDAAAAASQRSLARWQPLFERAIQEGPKAVAVLDHMLMQQDPEYAEVRGIEVTAHAETDVSAAPPTSEKQPGAPDVRATPEMDFLVREHFLRNPQRASAWQEHGWKMHKDGSTPESPANKIGPQITGKESQVDFRWTNKDGVSATIHTHPKKIGAQRLNDKNRDASERDHDLVNVGKVPAYVYGPTGEIVVLERVNGKIVQRPLTGDEE